MKRTDFSFYKIINPIIAIACSAGIAAGIGFLLYRFGFYLQGSAVYTQLYKLDMVADSIRQGAWFPLYAKHWYNGYEIFRYDSPAAYILITMLSRLFHADVHISICLFYAIMTFLSQMGFFLFGIRQKKMTAAFLTGFAFLFLPSTIYIAILQGCFDVVMGLGILPMLLFFLHDFVRWKHRLSLLPLSILFCVFVLTNYILAVVFGIVMLVYLFFYAFSAKEWKFSMAALGNLILLYLAMGYFLYPALSGGLLGRSYFLHGDLELPIGISFFIIALLGFITADRNRFAGFLLAMAGAVLSFRTLEPIMKLIPSSALQKTYWYLIVITAILLITLLCWERLRLFFLFVILAVLTAESLPVIHSLPEGTYALQQDKQMISDYLLGDIASCTDNRAAIMDDTTLGAFPHWYLASQNINTLQGWDYENSSTIWNQTHLNEAFTDGFYDYAFDRLLLYGNDTVLIVKELLPEANSRDLLLAAAQRGGYTVKAENEYAIVLKAEAVTGTYGVITQYENLAIGDNAAYIAYIYPSFGFGGSSCLEDYSVEELSQYRKLYLSGFTYREKEKAENLLKELSRKGTEVYIDMQNIPINQLTGKNEFMGVYAQFVQFTEDFPILQNDNGNQFRLDFEAMGNGIWNTVYISGCEEILKETTYDNKNHLTYLGRNTEPNITFMGFNLVYYYLTTHNQDLLRFINEAMNLSPDVLPRPVLVPTKVERENSQLTVHAPADGVNCSIACIDTLKADRIVSTQENLWVINEGATTFRIVRAGRRNGMFLTILGIIGTGILWLTIYVLSDSENEENRMEAKQL